MRHTHTMAVVTLGITLWVFSLPLNAQAKAKAKVLGCTTEDLNTNFGSSCASQGDKDIANGRSYTHRLVCEGGKMKCCTFSNSTNQAQTCRNPPGSAAMSGRLNNLPPAQVFSRGVEGEEEVGEETPVPSWLTESWLKEHEGEKLSK